MSVLSDALLKLLFLAGDTISQQDMVNLIDSKVNVGDAAGLAGISVNITASPYNGNGNGSVDNAAAFIQANADLAALGGGTIYIPNTGGGDFRTADNIPLSSLVRLEFEAGAQILPAVGTTISNVTLSNPPANQIFGGAGTILLSNRTPEILPQWWGALGDNSHDDSTAINLAIAAANTFTQGTRVRFLPGTYYTGTTQLTRPGKGTHIIGQGWDYVNSPLPPSTIRSGITAGTPLWDYGNNLTAAVTIEKMGFSGGGGVNKLSHCFYSASAQGMRFIDVFFDNWGGSAIKFDAGSNAQLQNVWAQNCLLGGSPITLVASVLTNTGSTLSTYQGIIHFGVESTTVFTEVWMNYCNISGNVFKDGSNVYWTGARGSGYYCAIYINGSPNRCTDVVGAFAQTGWVLDTGGSVDSMFAHCRGEYNQGDGFLVLSGHNTFCPGYAQSNSKDTDGAYGGWQIASGINVFACIEAQGISSDANKMGYIFKDTQAVGAPTDFFRANFYGKYRMNNMSASAVPLLKSGYSLVAVENNNVPQAVSVANAGTLSTLDAQAGDEWLITASNASGNSSITIGAPLNPFNGKQVTVSIINSSGGTLTTAFPASFKMSGYTDPANGKRRTFALRYDGTNWWQQGGVSGDL